MDERRRPYGARRTWPIRCRAFDRTSDEIPAAAGVPWTGCVSWTEWVGARARQASREVRDVPFEEFVALLERTGRMVIAKGRGVQVAGGLSSDGRHRDVSCAAVTMLQLDADCGRDWTQLLAVLDASELSYAVQRSSGHEPHAPRWHLILPLACALAPPPEKPEYAARYAHVIGVFDKLAAFPGPRAGDPHGVGFDPTTDALLNQSFLPARRSEDSSPRVVVSRVTGLALDHEKFLAATEWDRDFNERVLAAETARRPKLVSSSGRKGAAETDTSGRELPPLALAFRAAHWLGEFVRNGWRARCPFFREHTDSVGEWDAALFPSGIWYCCHAACDGRRGLRRRQADVVGLLPDEALAVYERALADSRRTKAVQELVDELARREVPAQVSAAEAAARIADEIASAAACADSPSALSPIVVLKVTPQAGKSRAAVDFASDCGASRRLVYATPRNELAIELRGLLADAGRSSERLFGIASRDEDGKPVCRIHEVVAALADNGVNASRLCERCKFRRGCKGYGGHEGKPGAVMAVLCTHAGVPRALHRVAVGSPQEAVL